MEVCKLSEKKDLRGYPFKVDQLVDYQEDSVVSRTLVENNAGSITIFSFDMGQALSEHTAPYEALVQVIEGKAVILLGGEKNELEAGDSIIMPADVPHALRAPEKFKMVLTMIRG